MSTLGYAAKCDLQRPKAAWEAPQLKGDDSFLKIRYSTSQEHKSKVFLHSYVQKCVCPQGRKTI